MAGDPDWEAAGRARIHHADGLEALEANQRSQLCSIDLAPPLEQQRLDVEVGAAVTRDLNDRWTLIVGSSRRRLPALLREFGTIDLFVHDGRHIRRNTCFELRQAWPAVGPGGYLLVDDIHGTVGFE